ncbi:hypothetical protein CANCADRAFT_57479 [Tortispora caseinolytica NRRL Y-17796]|uniref:Nucleoporin Nup54 alpha-helical domain-containing protein n=1 Tax=Tortispora caseinolytica NRRL Y-17796 TaxID=767744 RepID=A0A1E4THC2_9ASCO|nr:hypothetical protein CANCADRAFT_57479 [Tortispora caseinolytica NRRL Y-17796]
MVSQQPSFAWSLPSDSKKLYNQSLYQGLATPSTVRSGRFGGELGATRRSDGPAPSASSIPSQLARLKNSWDPSSPECVFQYFFYNRVPTEHVALYGKPDRASDAGWEAALAKRPDNQSVPVLAVGFDDVAKRAALQEKQVMTYRARMHEINDRLSQLSSRHDLHSTAQAHDVSVRLQALAHRTLRLAIKVQVAKSHGFSLRPDEERLRVKLQELLKQVEDPAVFGRRNEAWARMSVLRERTRTLDSSQTTSGALGLSDNDEQLDNGVKILRDEQAALAYLIDVVRQDSDRVNEVLSRVRERISASQSAQI